MPKAKKRISEPVSQPSVIYSQPNNNILYVMMGVITLFLIFITVKMFSLESKVNNTTSQQIGTTQQGQQPKKIEVKIDQVKKLFGKDYIHFGDANKKLLFVEVSDPSCPYCHVAGGKNNEVATQIGPNFQYQENGGAYIPPVPEIKKLVDEGKASFAYLYSNGHGSGTLAAQSLYCAFEKNKFWEVHDRLMTNEGYKLMNEVVANDKTKIPELVNFLSYVIDTDFLTQCLQSDKYKDSLARDEKLSPSIGYQGTPHFLVNTNMFQGAYSFKEMKTVVDKSL